MKEIDISRAIYEEYNRKLLENLENDVVVTVAPDNEAHQLVLQYLAGQLQCGQNICDH